MVRRFAANINDLAVADGALAADDRRAGLAFTERIAGLDPIAEDAVRALRIVDTRSARPRTQAAYFSAAAIVIAVARVAIRDFIVDTGIAHTGVIGTPYAIITIRIQGAL